METVQQTNVDCILEVIMLPRISHNCCINIFYPSLSDLFYTCSVLASLAINDDDDDDKRMCCWQCHLFSFIIKLPINLWMTNYMSPIVSLQG